MPGPAYRIHTRRLVLRCWAPSDAPLLKSAIDASMDHLQRWMHWAAQEPVDLDSLVQRLRRSRANFDRDEDYSYAIFDRQETMVLGGTGLYKHIGEGAREIGYWIHQDHINQGYATEAAAALTKVAFEIDGVGRVEIHCDPRNICSLSIPRKLGFLHEATLRARMLNPQGNSRDTMIWTLFAEDYPSCVCSKAEIEAYDVIGRKLL